MPNPQRETSDFELLWQALERLLPGVPSEIYRMGILGEVLRGRGQRPLASDLTDLWIPGLAALGVEARLLPLSKEERGREHSPHRNEEIFWFGFAAPWEFSPPEEIDDTTPTPVDTDPQILAQARLLRATPEGFSWQNAQGLVEQERFPSHFSHALSLHRSVGKPLRRAGIQAVLQRWSAWHAATPNRAPREGDPTEPACFLAAAFLWETVGSRRDLVSNRLRYAAHCFETAQVERAHRWLQEAAIAMWQLSAAPAEALLTPPEQPLSDLLRRELIYFARAGILPLKTLAARRLTHEIHHPDARKTLHQLRFDAHPWVRAAARPMPPHTPET